MNNNIDKLKKKYVGKTVYAGGELKGVYGKIVDIVEDSDFPDTLWFCVSEFEDGHVSQWDKSELKEVIVTTKLIPLR